MGREKQVVLCVEGEYRCDWLCAATYPPAAPSLLALGAGTGFQAVTVPPASRGFISPAAGRWEPWTRRQWLEIRTLLNSQEFVALQGGGWRCSRSTSYVRCAGCRI